MESKTIALHAFCSLISQFGSAINAVHQEPKELRIKDFSADGKSYEERKISITNASVGIIQNYIPKNNTFNLKIVNFVVYANDYNYQPPTIRPLYNG